MAEGLALPKLMVAPTGARRTQADHAQLPINVSEIVSTAQVCHAAGADGIHIHVRDKMGSHTLDAGLYNEVLRELEVAVPGLVLQITTEAVGQYSPQQQRDLVLATKPASVSISIAEMLSDGDTNEVIRFYQDCESERIAVQHIFYGVEDLEKYELLLHSAELKTSFPHFLFVLGRYAKDKESRPSELEPFTQWMSNISTKCDWAVCAFGRSETNCLIAADKLGAKLRVGFENSLWNQDGSVAVDNAQRVAEIARLTTGKYSTHLS